MILPSPPPPIKSILPILLLLLLPAFFPLSLSKSAMAGKRSSLSPPSSPAAVNNKLRRLPHVFSKVLELPFDSDADVSVEDRPDCLRFVAAGVDVAGEVLAHVVKVHPGVTKVVIRKRENRSQPLVDELEFDIWRFRLPAAALPELAKAVYGGGQLVVTVPKNGWRKIERCVDDFNFRGGSFRRDNHMGTLVLV